MNEQKKATEKRTYSKPQIESSTVFERKALGECRNGKLMNSPIIPTQRCLMKS